MSLLRSEGLAQSVAGSEPGERARAGVFTVPAGTDTANDVRRRREVFEVHLQTQPDLFLEDTGPKA